MDKGNGFLERFIISTPTSYRKLPSEQKLAADRLKSCTIEIKDLYDLVNSMENSTFYLEEDALEYVKKSVFYGPNGQPL